VRREQGLKSALVSRMNEALAGEEKEARVANRGMMHRGASRLTPPAAGAPRRRGERGG
jgi:hypothetical protein